MREIDTVQGAVNIIQNSFAKEYERMDFIFTHRLGSHRIVLLVLRGLHGMIMRVSNSSPPDVAFESTWVSDPKDRKKQLSNIPQGGWQDVEATSWRVQYSYLAHAFANIRKVREVSIFDYGFELFSFDRVELIGIKSSAWRNPSVGHLQSIVGEQFKGIKLAEDVDDELKITWRHPVVIEKMKQIENKRKSFVQLGQSVRDLLFDVEEI